MFLILFLILLFIGLVPILGITDEEKSDSNDDTVSFCTRCFSKSAVQVKKDKNFCHYCGSYGTCISIKRDEADYLQENIQHSIDMARK